MFLEVPNHPGSERSEPGRRRRVCPCLQRSATPPPPPCGGFHRDLYTAVWSNNNGRHDQSNPRPSPLAGALALTLRGGLHRDLSMVQQ